jgi:hypothetical protein
VAISARGLNNLALCADGSVIGMGNTTPPALTNAIAVAAGATHGVALLANNSIVTWGHNNYGQLDVPASATNIVAIAAGDYDTVALEANGALIEWGYDTYDQTPAPISPPSIMALGAGSLHSLAVIGQTPAITVAVGGSTLLSSGNLGSGLGTFQWLYDGVAIAGATNSSLALTNLQWFNSGVYQVVMSNPLQVVAGPAINVTVPTFQFDPTSLAYNPANGSLTIRLNGASGTNPVVIYASPDLVNWQPIFTNAPTVNSIEFTDAPPPNQPQRFYRAMQ